MHLLLRLLLPHFISLWGSLSHQGSIFSFLKDFDIFCNVSQLDCFSSSCLNSYGLFQLWMSKITLPLHLIVPLFFLSTLKNLLNYLFTRVVCDEQFAVIFICTLCVSPPPPSRATFKTFLLSLVLSNLIMIFFHVCCVLDFEQIGSMSLLLLFFSLNILKILLLLLINISK